MMHPKALPIPMMLDGWCRRGQRSHWLSITLVTVRLSPSLDQKLAVRQSPR